MSTDDDFSFDLLPKKANKSAKKKIELTFDEEPTPSDVSTRDVHTNNTNANPSGASLVLDESVKIVKKKPKKKVMLNFDEHTQDNPSETTNNANDLDDILSAPPKNTLPQNPAPTEETNTNLTSNTVKRQKVSAMSMFDGSLDQGGPKLSGQLTKTMNPSHKNPPNPPNPAQSSTQRINIDTVNKQQMGATNEAPHLSFVSNSIPKHQNIKIENFDNGTIPPLLDAITPTQLYKPQADYTSTTRYKTAEKQTERNFNRDYYNMDENSGSGGGGSNETELDLYKYSKRQSNQLLPPQTGVPTQSLAQSHREAKALKRNQDATGWEDEKRAMAMGLTIHRDLDELNQNIHEESVIIYPDEHVPEFLCHYQTETTQIGSDGRDKHGNGGGKSSLSMFKQDSVKVCQKMDGNMMRLAKEGNQSIIEYRSQKERLQNTDRFWEEKGNVIGAITGANNLESEEDRKRKRQMTEQQKNEIGGYVGDGEWIAKQLAIDQILYRDQHQKDKEEMLKQIGVKNSNNNKNEKSNVKNEIKNILTPNESEKIIKHTPHDVPLEPTTIISHPPTHSEPHLQEPAPSLSFPDDDTTTLNPDPELTPAQRHALKRLEIKHVRDNLPAFGARQEFLKHTRQNQVVIVVGETGSGKTTQLCQYLYETGYSTIPPPPPGYKWTPDEDRLMEDDFNEGDNNNNLNKTNNSIQNPPMDEYTRQMIRMGKRIAITQPRRVAATSVANRVAEEVGVELGTTVGYTIRFEQCSSPYTAIKFMTDGILLRETLSSPNLDQYSVIIMDEAHERSLNTDILFGLLRTILTRRSDLKLIVTSATMNAEAFSTFFGNAPIMHISGRTYPVEVNFGASVPSDYIIAAAQRVLQCHLMHVVKTTIPVTTMVPVFDSATNSTQMVPNVTTIDHLQPTGDILVFMTGQDDVEATCYYIRQELEKANVKLPLWILPITSTLPQDVQSRIFAPSSIRKCIVATNIAETSLTIDGVRYVIDTGLYKLKTYNPQIGMDMLTVTPISQASANQRKGRAGRTSAGICYRLYRSEEFFNELLSNNIAEIHRTNLSNVILTLKAIHRDVGGGGGGGGGSSSNIFTFPFLEKPSSGSLLSALYQLYLLGAIDNNERITPIGSLMTLLPLDPPLSRILIESIRLQCLPEVLTLTAMLTIPNIYYRPNGKQDIYEPLHARFALGDGDFITLVNIYQLWAYYGYSEQWCNDNYLQYKGLMKAREIRSQLVNLVKNKEFCEQVMNCFATQNERENAMSVAKEQFSSWKDKNLGSNRGGGGGSGGSGGASQYTNPHNKRIFNHDIDNDTTTPTSHTTSLHTLPNQPQKRPNLTQLYFNNLNAYHTFQILLQNATHITTSTTTASQWADIRKCICSGYFINAAKLLNGTTYQNLRTGISCEVHFTSTIGSGNDFVVYQDIVVTGKNYMRMVSSVEPQWLIEYGKLLYKMRIKKRL
jgi:HrpA-like RNA helicase